MRNRAIDMAKGLGMIWIIISHTGYSSQIAKYFYYMYVPIFFVCSAYVYKEKKTMKEGIIYTLRRLLIPLLLARLLFIAFDFLFAYMEGNLAFTTSTFFEIIRNNLYSRYCFYPLFSENNIFFNKYGGCEWFLPLLILSSILYIVIEHFGKKINSNIYYPCVCAALLLISLLLNKLPILLPWSIDTAPMCTIFMLFGDYLKRIDFMNQPLKVAHLPLSICLVLLLKIIANCNKDVNLSVRIYGFVGDISVILYAVNVIIACYLTLLLCKLLDKKNIFTELAFIGKHTLLLYIANGNIMDLFERTLGWRISSLYSYDIYCLIKVLFAIMFITAIDCIYRSIKKRINDKKLAI